MPWKRPPETDYERRERVERIGRQIAEAIKLDREAALAAEGQDWNWRPVSKPTKR